MAYKTKVVTLTYSEEWMEKNATNIEAELGWLTDSQIKIEKIEEPEKRERLTVNTPLGKIEAVDAGYSNDKESYPGIWIEINGEGMALAEFDATLQKHVIRVWNQDDIDNDPEYRQVLKEKKEEYEE